MKSLGTFRSSQMIDSNDLSSRFYSEDSNHQNIQYVNEKSNEEDEQEIFSDETTIIKKISFSPFKGNKPRREDPSAHVDNSGVADRMSSLNVGRLHLLIYDIICQQ